jgi:hypothetical protein
MAEEKKPVGGQEETSKISPETKETDSTPDEAISKGEGNELTKIRSRNFMVLVHYLEKQDINPCAFLHTSEGTIKKIASGKQNASFFMVWRMQRGFSNISYRKVRMGKQELPSNEDYGFEQRTAKLRYLDKFLVEKAQGLTLARALSLSLPKWKQLESGWDIPSKALMKRDAIYFSLPPKMLLDDEEKLPSFDQLKIDEDLAAIQRNDLAETMNYYKNKHYIARNYRVLSHAMRVKLYLSLFVILIPLVGFTGYSTYRILNDRFSSIQKMEQTDIVDSKSKKFKEEYIDAHTKQTDPKLYYCPVKVCVQIMKIFDIQPSNEYFSVAMKLWFDFSQDEFHNMYRNYIGDPTYDATPSSGSAYKQDNDIFTVSRTDNSVSYGSDQIPDYLELATPFDLAKGVDDAIAKLSNPSESEIQECARQYLNLDSTKQYLKIRNYWTAERNSYPGLFPSSIYKDYDPNFDVGKGVDSSSLLYDYDPGEPYYLSKADGTRSYRMIQSMRFAVKVSKAYDNPRYPLETAQFWINVEPAKWLTVNHIRYEIADKIDLSRDQISGTEYQSCSRDDGIYTTMGDSVAFTDGFRSVKETDKIKAYAQGIEYNVDPDYAEKSYSKYTIVIRANRAAFTTDNFLPSTFLQAYINLAAVIIWIIIGFYNQTYAGEDSLGMLGTGMFSAISATIVGFQMLSDASMFSLMTMINIFTLAVILIMTYQAVQAKKANARKDKALIAYNGVKLRVMYYLLTICTAIMFIGLPIACYIWTL